MSVVVAYTLVIFSALKNLHPCFPQFQRRGPFPCGSYPSFCIPDCMCSHLLQGLDVSEGVEDAGFRFWVPSGAASFIPVTSDSLTTAPQRRAYCLWSHDPLPAAQFILFLCPCLTLLITDNVYIDVCPCFQHQAPKSLGISQVIGMSLILMRWLLVGYWMVTVTRNMKAWLEVLELSALFRVLCVEAARCVNDWYSYMLKLPEKFGSKRWGIFPVSGHTEEQGEWRMWKKGRTLPTGLVLFVPSIWPFLSCILLLEN